MNFRQNCYFEHAASIRQAELRFQIPTDMLAALLYQASAFEPDRIAGKGYNPIGVIGIAKIARDDCAWLWGGADHRTDPQASITAAARILQRHYRRFNNWRDAVAAYHTSAEIVAAHHHGKTRLPIDAARYLGELETVVSI